MTLPPALVLGGSYNVYSVARSLGARGVEVHALGDGTSGRSARYSRFVSSAVDPREPAEAWPLWMDRMQTGVRPAVVLACSDHGLEFIARNRTALLELGYLPAESNDDVTLAMLDKAATYELAGRAGIETPQTAVVHSRDQLLNVAVDFNFPCALKPRDSYRFARQFGTKGFVVSNRFELEEAFQRIGPTQLEMIVTEIVPGTDDEYCSYYSYLDQRGDPLFHFTKRKLRQYPPGFGSGTYHVSAWQADVATLGLQFFQGVGLRGIGNVEFKRDRRDGRLKLIECNPRFTAADGLVQRAGVDIAWVAYRRALGETVAPRCGFRSGVRQWYPVDDILALRAYRQSGRMNTGAWLASMAHVQHLPVFEWRDPLPSFVYDLSFARRCLQWAVRQGRRRAAASRR